MAPEELDHAVSGIRYKKGWHLRLARDRAAAVGGRMYLQWSFYAPDYEAGNGVEKLWFCRKHYLSEHMTEGEVVQTAFMAALQAEEHECREAFSYMGKRLFNPHIDVAALMSVCDQIKGRNDT